LAISLDSTTLVSTSRDSVFLFNHGEKKEFDVDKYICYKEDSLLDTSSCNKMLEDGDNPYHQRKGILERLLGLLGINNNAEY